MKYYQLNNAAVVTNDLLDLLFKKEEVVAVWQRKDRKSRWQQRMEEVQKQKKSANHWHVEKKVLSDFQIDNPNI